MLDHHRAGIFGLVEGREEHEQPVVAIFPWPGAAVRHTQRNDLRGARLARHLDVVERQARTSGGAGAVDHIAHRLSDIADLVGAEIEMLELRGFAAQPKPWHDLVASGHACAHHRELQGIGQVISLPDRRIHRVVRLPRAVMATLLPFGRRDGAVKLAGDGEGKLFPEPHLVRPFRDLCEADLLREMVEIAVATLVDRLGHIDAAMVAPAIEEAIADPAPAIAHDRLVGFDTRIEKGHAVHRLHRRTRWIKPLENLVAKRHPLVLAQHAVFDASDAL